MKFTTKNFWSKLGKVIYKFKNVAIIKHILFFYLLITLIGSALLMMPVSQTNNDVKYSDALFTAASAFSDTGLVTVSTYNTWTSFGQAIIAVLILCGGIGIFAIKVYFINILFGKPLSYNGSEALSAERGSIKIGITSHLIKTSVTILFAFIFLFSIGLTIYFYNAEVDMQPVFDNPQDQIDAEGDLGISPYHNLSLSLRYGIFHTISSLNNAGFDIIGPNSLSPYYYETGLQVIILILFISGGVGFPVIYDIYLWIRSKIKKENFKWSLFTKLSMATYVFVSFAGMILTIILETSVKTSDSFWNEASGVYGSKGNKIFALVFNSFSTRNAGFSTVNLHHFQHSTLMLYCVLMFIGSAPSSTAGGIRTTTMAVVILGIWNQMRGRSSIRAFKTKINSSTANRAYVVFTTSILLCIFVALIGISSISDYGGNLNTEGFSPTDSSGAVGKYGFMEILFETVSAFGTTGLSTGLTSGITLGYKLSLILLMFIGQLGVSSTILLWGKRNSKSNKYEYVEQDITIG